MTPEVSAQQYDMHHTPPIPHRRTAPPVPATPDNDRTLHIRNMVCNRCIMVVRDTLERLGMEPRTVGLGLAELAEAPTEAQRKALREALEALGFELIDNRREQWVERIRNAIVERVHHGGGDPRLHLSDYLAERLGRDYDTLSRLFSEETGSTIEKYLIAQRIERAKELLSYGELTLSQIADELHYSSVAYLSTQFKSITGMTPSAFRTQQTRTGAERRPLDEL